MNLHSAAYKLFNVEFWKRQTGSFWTASSVNRDKVGSHRQWQNVFQTPTRTGKHRTM